MIFLSVILFITALWIPANANVTVFDPDGLIPTVLGGGAYYYDYSGAAGVGDIGVLVIGILGLTTLLSAIRGVQASGGGGAAAICPSCPPVMSCPGAACSTALTCGGGYTERMVNGERTCYQILTGPYTDFPTAQRACAGTGGSLVSISNAAELTEVQSFITANANPASQHYTGIRDYGGSVTNNPVINICTGEIPNGISGIPLNVAGAADCVTVTGDDTESRTCVDDIPAFCEKGLNNMCTCTATTVAG